MIFTVSILRNFTTVPTYLIFICIIILNVTLWRLTLYNIIIILCRNWISSLFWKICRRHLKSYSLIRIHLYSVARLFPPLATVGQDCLITYSECTSDNMATVSSWKWLKDRVPVKNNKITKNRIYTYLCIMIYLVTSTQSAPLRTLWILYYNV